jgi:hypothetical protein
VLLACLGLIAGPGQAEPRVWKACEVFTLADAETLIEGGLGVVAKDASNQGYFFESEGEPDAVAIPLESYCDYSPRGPGTGAAAVPARKVVIGIFNTLSPQAAEALYGALLHDSEVEAARDEEPRVILRAFPLEGLGVPAFATETRRSASAEQAPFVEAYALKGQVVLFATAWRPAGQGLETTSRALARALERLE